MVVASAAPAEVAPAKVGAVVSATVRRSGGMAGSARSGGMAGSARSGGATGGARSGGATGGARSGGVTSPGARSGGARSGDDSGSPPAQVPGARWQYPSAPQVDPDG